MNHYTTIARDTFRPTQAQLNYLGSLCEARGFTSQRIGEMFRKPINNAEFSTILQWVKGQPLVQAPSPAAPAQSGKTHTVPKLPTGKRGYGYYAIPAGELGYSKPHFFRVKNAKGTGFQYLDEKASDELYPVRGARRAEVMKWLAAHEKEAGALYANLIGNCRFCHKDLTDEDNPYKAQGAGPDCGPKYLG